ncbi:hypothetical protein [Streptomyces sp. NRRL S-87]|uniref:hypothetical protein n=1 Tax=Streptomyces sp. NRRL S-87 TaxID=1463920 RepID=UPI000A8D56D3|nr:hypothetical protein [Streptomyces sp. NRRL S-87]
MSSDRWTSDLLLTEQGSTYYAKQIREIFRAYHLDFRVLADEVYGHLLQDPIEGDGPLAARLHAWRISRPLREMAKHAQAIMDGAKALEVAYRRGRIELPRARADKAAQKELHKASKHLTAAPSGVVNQVAQAVASDASGLVPAQPQPQQQTPQPSQPVMPLSTLFKAAE